MLFFFQAEDGIRDLIVTGVQTCALPILKTDSEQEVVLQQAGMVIQHGLLYPIVTAFDIAKDRKSVV